jgi:hypothetical protein
MTTATEKQLLLSYLDEVLSSESSKLVGKLLKRVDIITDKEFLKKDIKELIYEQMREIRDIFIAYSNGIEVQYFNFKTNKEK